MPEVGYCKKCKWWNRSGFYNPRPDWGTCGRTKWPYEGSEVPEEVKTSLCEPTSDDTVYDRWLQTHRDFGCVQWEPEESSHG